MIQESYYDSSLDITDLQDSKIPNSDTLKSWD